MKLTIIGINYSPEPTGVAVYTSGLANGLASSDDELQVQVVTGYPHYPQWKIYPGFVGRSRTETKNNLRVRWLRHYVPSAPRLLNRLAMEIHFGVRSVFARWGKPDRVLLVTPALFSVGIASLRARMARIPVTIWVQDIYSLGVSESGTGGSAAARAVGRLERSILRSANTVVVIHDRFKRYLVDEMHLDADRVEVVRNWSHVGEPSTRRRADARAARGWQADDVVALHAGNMGAKQGLENVVDAAKLAEARGSRVRFVLLGDGNQRTALEAMGASDRLDFVDPLSDDDFSDALAAADVLLVNERPGLTEMSVPSKLTTYFASGRPVLAATDASSVTAEELTASHAGIRVDAADPAALLDAAEWLTAHPVESRAFGDAGRSFSAALLSPDVAIASFSRITGLSEAPVSAASH